MRLLSILLIFGCAFFGCKENSTPKPHGYLKITLPVDHSYKESPDNLPFTLEYSSHAEWSKLKTFKKSHTGIKWYNIEYPKYNAKIHLSYIPIRHNLDSLIEESHKFVFEHTIRADEINETVFHKEEKGVHGILFDLEGNSASNMEFLATDSMEHFIRGALYFETTPNVDSLSPIIKYIKTDIIYMINSIEWACQ